MIQKTLHLSFKNSLWVLRSFLFINIVTILVLLIFSKDFKSTCSELLVLLWINVFMFIFMFGFFIIFIHCQYFSYEKGREIELTENFLTIKEKNGKINEIKLQNINSISLYDRKRTFRYDENNRLFSYNVRPTMIDGYYYIAISLKNDDRRIIITCLMNMRLKKTIEDWSNIRLEHQYQFVPFIKKEFIKNAL